MSALLRLLLVAVVGLTLAACGDAGGGRPFTIVSGSENTEIEPIVQDFCKEKGFACTFKYEGSLDIGLALQGSSLDADAVWPASGVWVDLFDTGRKVANATSIAQMPVILGVRKSKAEQLGWIGKPVTMKDILAAVQSGQLKFLMTSATQSNSGASAYLAMLTSALGSAQAVLQADDLDKPEVRDTVKALLAGVARSSGSSGWLSDLYVKTATEGTQYDAMWNYEAILKSTNDQLRHAGKEQLYAIYPADGVAVADSPLGFVDRGNGPAYQQFFSDLVKYLQTPATEQRIADTGRRIPLAGNITARPEPDWNFDPTRLVTAIRLPEPAVIRAALDLYQSALRKPSLTSLCLDYSGSMQGPGEQQLEAAMSLLLTPAEASKVLVQWSPEDRILVFPFEASVRQGFSATGSAADQATLLDEVTAESADGGTDMYACAEAALSAIKATPNLDNYLPAIVIMTDGRTDGSPNDFLNQWRSVDPRVPVFGITFGDAETNQLTTLANDTSGRVFDGKADLAGAFRAARGYN